VRLTIGAKYQAVQFFDRERLYSSRVRHGVPRLPYSVRKAGSRFVEPIRGLGVVRAYDRDRLEQATQHHGQCQRQPNLTPAAVGPSHDGRAGCVKTWWGVFDRSVCGGRLSSSFTTLRT
jgi:hypothetical protein